MDQSPSIHNPEKQFMSEVDPLCVRLRSGYSESWRHLEGALGPVRVAYGMFVMLPLWLGIVGCGGRSTAFRLKHSAFLVYKTQVENDLEASLLLAMMGHYSAGEVLLRSCLEYICRGAFLDSIAKRRLREDCPDLLQTPSKPDSVGERGSIQRLFDDIEERSPGFLDEMEENSVVILDKLAPFMSDPVFGPMIPDMRRTVEQIHNWGFFTPIDKPVAEIYKGGYHLLSLPVHGSIDQIDAGSKLERGVNFLKTPAFDAPRLDHFIAHYNELLDVCLVLTLNLLLGDAPKLHDALLRVNSIPFYQQTPTHYFREDVQQRLAQVSR